MRKLAGSSLIPFLLLSFLVAAGLAGCGGGNGGTEEPRVLTKVTVIPASVSLNRGQVQQVTVRALDQEDDPILADFSFATSNDQVFEVANNGLVCGGDWDSLTTPVVCTPRPPGMANLTVTATAGGVTVTSDLVPVFVHEVVDNIVITPAAVDCLSQDNDTGPDLSVQFSAQAFNGTTDITSTVGPFTWQSAQTNVATITSDGVATGELPGVSNITASIGGVVSPAAALTICPPASITLHVTDPAAPTCPPTPAPTSFSLAVNGTQTLDVDICDTLGEPLENVPVTFQIVNPSIASINTSTRVVTGSAAGVTGIIAHCTPPGCNQNSVIPTYSNVVMATVTGTPAAGTVYATCASAAAPCTTAATGGGTQTPLVPINTSTDTAGTAINLPQTPNSMVFTRDGATIFLGSANGLMIVDAGSNTFQNTVANLPGRVLAVSPGGTVVVVSDIPGASVFIFDRNANSIQVLGISDATAAAFTPDGLRLYIVAANTLFVASPVFSLQTLGLGSVANDVAVLPGGSFAYLAGGGVGPTITARATCNNAEVDSDATTATSPSLIAALPDGSRVLGVNSPGLEVLTPSPAFTGCPPDPAGTLAPQVDFGQGPFTARQIFVLPTAARAYVTSDLASLLAYDVAGGTASTIAIGGASPTTGGATIDGARLYVGGSDNAVHRIDVATATEVLPSIGLSFTPDLVAVRPR